MDSGSSCCLIDADVYEALPNEVKTPLIDTTSNLRGADGTRLEVAGDAIVDVHIMSKLFPIKFTVARLGGIQAIVGINFLASTRATMDLEEGILTFDDMEVQLHHHSGSSCFLVLLSEAIEVPAHSMVPVKGAVEELKGRLGDALLETQSWTAKNTEAVFPDCLVRFEENGKVCFPVLNHSDEAQSFLPKTPVAELTFVDSSEIKEISSFQTLKDALPDYNCFTVLESGEPRGSVDPSALPDHLSPLLEEAAEHITLDQENMVRKLLCKHADVFAKPGGSLGCTTLIEHEIRTTTERPIREKFRRYSPHHRQLIEQEIKELLQKGVIEPSRSAYNSPLVLIKKKCGQIRICQDARLVNEITEFDSYPLPNCTDCLDAVGGSTWYATMDLQSGFWQINLKESSRHKTAFQSPSGGLYQWTKMPFGYKGAPATFQRLMERVMGDLQWRTALLFLDDILVFARTFDELMERVDQVLGRLSEAGLLLKPSKTHLVKRQAHFLGHFISEKGIEPCPKKIQAVRDWPTPLGRVKDVRSFLGLASYYRRFIRGFAQTAAPLTNLLRKSQKFQWTEDCELAVNKLKEALTSYPILRTPSSKKDDVFILDTDCSDSACAAVLSQIQDGEEVVIAYASRTLSKSRRNYCVTMKELFAAVTFVEHYRHLLEGVFFRIRTDHAALVWLSLAYGKTC